MKKLVVILAIFAPLMLSAYNWDLFGPPGIVANNVCFSRNTIICTNTGICIDDGAAYSWNYYSNKDMPVLEAIPFDTANILLVMGNGSSSDGIYKFNLTNHQFNLVEYLSIPTFIKYCVTNNTYYAGSFYNGLLSSVDGINWTAVPYFISKGCKSMDFYENHFVVTQHNNVYAIYCSNDTGRTWAQSACIPIYQLGFNSKGKLFGIFTGNSKSSGLYTSSDFGQTWQLGFYSINMNCIGFDMVNNNLFGWKSSSSTQEGIAKFNETTSSMTFLNDGLPNKQINKILTNPVMSSITIFCCTDSGVYSSNNYWVSIPNTFHATKKLAAFAYPNPSSGITTIEYGIPTNPENSKLQISLFNNFGILIKEFHPKAESGTINHFTFDVSDLVDGEYYYRLTIGNSSLIEKLIVRK